MGLFDWLKKGKADEKTEVPETVGVSKSVNLTPKMVKVPVTNREDDGELFKGGYIWEEENLIQVKQGDRILFEVTPRSKVYDELKPLARKKLQYVVIEERDGDYGKYYRARLRYETTREEVFGK